MSVRVVDFREDRSDTMRSIALHDPSGEIFIVDRCSLWADGQCVGDHIFRATDAIARGDIPGGADWPIGEWPISVQPAVLDWMDTIPDGNFDDESADWLNDEQDAGRLKFPISRP